MTAKTDTNPTKAFYDRISNAYDLIADSSEHGARERGLALLAAAPGEKALVIGFGTGHSVVSLARAVSPGGKVSGIDISQGMYDVAQRRWEREGSGVSATVELLLGDARALKFADNSLDVAFSSFTLELFEDDDLKRVLAEIRRVLRPGGRLGVVSMSKEAESTVATEIYVWMHRHFPHFVDCHPIDVPGFLTQAGFQVDKIEKISIWGLPVAIVTAKK